MAKSVQKCCSFKRTFPGFLLPRVFFTTTPQWASGNVSLNQPVSTFASVTHSVCSSVLQLTGREHVQIPVFSCVPFRHLCVQVQAASLPSSPCTWTEKCFNKNVNKNVLIKNIKSLCRTSEAALLSPVPPSFMPFWRHCMLQSHSWHARWDDTAYSLWPDAYCRWKDH